MKFNFREKEFKLWIILSVIITILWSVVMAGIYNNQLNREEVYLENELFRLQGEVQSILLSYGKFSDYIYHEIDKDQEIKSIIEEANYASAEEKDLLREKLYNIVREKYIEMKELDYRQFHFHLPNTESFLRVHTPDKYGDLLAEYRESVRLVNEKLEKIKTFEEGRIFNGYRYVYPLFNDNKHIGSVELSISIKSIIEILSDIYSNEDFYFVVDKSVVKKKLFEEELSNYEELEILEDYYLDRETKEIVSAHSTVIPSFKETFFKNIADKNAGKIKDKESFSTISKFKDKYYTITFLAVEDIKKVPIAYLISITESIGVESFTRNIYGEIVLVTLIAILIIFLGLILAHYNLKLKDGAEKDYLTKIYNRNKFYELARQEGKLTKRYKYESAVLLLDIDHFKRINDEYGHCWGDKVLKKLASEISKSIRETDIFARWGGEEFVLLLPHTDKVDGLKTAEKIRRVICQSQTEELKEVTISVGVTIIDPENYDIDQAIKLADEAMYCAKENGRNQVCYR